MELALSRYVGISRWSIGDEPLADFIFDTTDRLSSRSMIALVAYQTSAIPKLSALGARLGAPAM